MEVCHWLFRSVGSMLLHLSINMAVLESNQSSRLLVSTFLLLKHSDARFSPFLDPDILTFDNVDATALSTRDDLPFQAAERQNDEIWVLWWQCPYADSNDPSTTAELLIQFISSAQNQLLPGDFIVIGWALNWEDGNMPPTYRVLTYNIPQLVVHAAQHRFRELVRDNKAIGIDIVDLGYQHSTNHGAPSIYGAYYPVLRTLILLKEEEAELIAEVISEGVELLDMNNPLPKSNEDAAEVHENPLQDGKGSGDPTEA